MQEKYLKKLDYFKILNILSSYAKTQIGKNLSLKLMPYNNIKEILIKLKETSEALDVINKNGSTTIEYFDDITINLKQLKSKNTLGIKSLLNIANILKLSRELKEYFKGIENCPSIEQYFFNLYSNINIENNILSKIIDENTLDDKASQKLFSIRKNQIKLQQDIRNKLNSFIHSSTYSKYLQDPIITIRNDRFVVPVKEEYRSFIKGFVHDISSSGSTIFIEPSSIFESNSQIANLKIEENLEIARILKELSSSLYAIVKELTENIELIGYIDFTFAKALYSKNTNSIEPILNTKKFLNLKQACHPLINKDIVVPIDISIGENFSCLLITGPNTGGKTVALKTVGLLSLMAQSGLHIPANENSNICVFDNIFADIGDEQSISDSLSTFSSHMLNIIEISNLATENSLILLDELGSGTDPIEGSKLAISILEYFYNLGTLTLSTTHYQELKEYSLVTNGFENASFEFNIETLSPTYRLLLGIPGKSNAFEISKKLGLHNNILNRAISLMQEKEINIEDLLKSIYDNKIEIEKQKEESFKNLHQIESLRKKLETDYSSLEEKANSIIINAKNEAREILLDAKDEVTTVLKNLKFTSNIKDIDNIRNNINNKIKNTSSVSNISESNSLNKEDISVGMEVLVVSFNKQGTILTLPNDSGNVEIQIGNVKSSININKLSKVSSKNIKAKNNNKSVYQSNVIQKSKQISNELNIIGLNVEEALPLVDKYLDDAELSSLEEVRIVHGKGTGKLRAGIQSFLKNHPHVKSFRAGTFGEGEMGVTVVTLKK